MDCSAFKNWLRNREVAAEREAAAMAHAGECPDCRRLWRLDREAEEMLRFGLARVETPAGLWAAITAPAGKTVRRSGSDGPWRLLRGPLIPALAMAGLILALIFSSSWFAPRFDSLEQIARLAEQGHMTPVEMEFRAAEVGEVETWFRGRLPFSVQLPVLATGPRLELAGGRVRQLGGRDTAYLAYVAPDHKRYSLFMLPAKEVPVALEEQKIYRYPVNQCVIELWKEAERVYVLVS